MANSGTAVGNNVSVSGSYYARLRIEWQLAGQNVGGNYSTINWQAYIDYVGCDAQADNGHVNWNGGALYNNGGRVYNYRGNFSNHTVGMGSGSFNIGHDGGGNANLNLNGSIAIYQSGTSSANQTWGLPTIPRYANFTAFGVSDVTDQGLTVYASADNNCSSFEFSIDGGATWVNVGGGSSQQYHVDNLPSGNTYNCYCRITRADSGLQTTSGVATVTTLLQNSFLPFL